MVLSTNLEYKHAFRESSSYISENHDDELDGEVKCDESENELEMFISAILFV